MGVGEKGEIVSFDIYNHLTLKENKKREEVVRGRYIYMEERVASN